MNGAETVTLRAEIKSLSSLDIDDLSAFVPPDPECFRVALRLIAGPAGEQGEESFDFTVCSPRWLEQELASTEPMLLRHKLVMRAFDFDRVTKFVERYVHGCSGETWEEVATKLGRLGHWEFEDYQE